MPKRRSSCALGATALALLLAGCGNEQSALRPASHASHAIATLFWWMMGIAWGGLALVVLLLFLSWKRRHRRGIGVDSEGEKAGERTGWYVVVGAGVIMPVALMAALFIVSDLFVIRATEAPAADATRLTVLVVGHQWWWEVRYPGTKVVTANEIHIPVRTPVRLEVRTDDVIHSVWVPELNRTIDTIPGRTNAIVLDAKSVGVYRGQCDEFCGLQHAHMAFFVIAQPAPAFHRWLGIQARPAAAPVSATAKQGKQVFMTSGCQQCHTIRGTSATGYVGPDLTHLADRQTLAAGTIPNRRDYLAGWVTNPQSVKPGNQMPDMQLSDEQLRRLLAYLEGLR